MKTSMSRLRLWLLCFPLVLAGSEVAHSLLGWLASPGYLGAELFETGSPTAALLAPLTRRGAAVHTPRTPLRGPGCSAAPG